MYKSELNNPLPGEYVRWQVERVNNIILLDDIFTVDFCDEFLNKSLSVKENDKGKWTSIVSYNEDWPVSEWIYILLHPDTHEWLDSHVKKDVILMWDYVKEIIEGKSQTDIKITGAHINASIFGQDSMVHNDADDGELFVIIFFNSNMNVYDGGEFQTYISMDANENTNKNNSNSEIYGSIKPISGRVIIVDSRILHRGLAPSRFFAKPRITVAFKIRVDDIEKCFNNLDFVI